MSLRDAARSLWYARSRFAVTNVPVPCRLPTGGWFLAYGDVMGLKVLGSSLSGHRYDAGEWRFLASFLGEGMTVFDVGANQGFYSVIAARHVGKSGSIVAFEPAPTEFRRLRRNLRLNGLQNVRAEPLAVGDQDGMTEFHLALDAQGSFSSLRAPAHDVTSRKRRIQVPVSRLDTFVEREGIAAMDLLKIDVEGGELAALRGARGSLDRFRPVVMCEMADVRTEPWGYAAAEIHDALAGAGYLVFEADEDGRLRASPKRKRYLPDWVNAIAVPAERASGLSRLIVPA